MYSGGQGVYLAALSREYVAAGHEVHVVVGPPYPELDARVVQHRLPDYSVFTAMDEGAAFWRKRPQSYLSPLNFAELATSRAGMFSVMWAFSLRAFEVVAKLHARHRFDVVHDNQSLGYGDLLIRLLGVPVVANIHHPLSIDRTNAVSQAQTLREKVGRVLFYPLHMQHVVAHGIDGVITGSEASALAVRRAFSLGTRSVAAIHYGVDTAIFRPDGRRREPGRVLFVGNSDDRNKGARYLVEALASLGGREWQLIVVDRVEAEVVRRRAGERGVEGRGTVTGRLSREGRAGENKGADVFVSPSLYEGFGLPAAEAQACAAPVIATTAGALPEVVRDGESGLLVPPGDPVALAGAIRLLLEDRALAARLGAAAARRIEAEFTWTRTAERTVKLYRDVIAGREGNGSRRPRSGNGATEG